MIHSNKIKNCPVTVEDVATASKIWGKNVDALKGKTTRSKPEVVIRDLVRVPKELMKLHKDIYLTREQDTVLYQSIEEKHVHCSPLSSKPHGSADI